MRLTMSDRSANLRTVNVVRYVTPLREGGSLPAIAEADDDFLYVLKFCGAGQGVKALIADLIGGEMARLMGFKVPEIVFAQLDSAFGRTEPDEEIQELLRKSEGLNLALHYLAGAITFDPVVNKVDALLASKIVWLDAWLCNVDRTARNTNMLSWNKELWLIDHGASLYFHHAGGDWQEKAQRPFTQIKEHVLLSWATEMEAADMFFKQLLTAEKIQQVLDCIPEAWLADNTFNATAAGMRNIYAGFLNNRIAASAIFVNEIQHARQSSI
jgi:hypothetical protein